MAQRRGPDGTARVAVSGTFSFEPWTNVFWCNLVGGTTATQAGFDAWVSAFGEAYFNAIAPQVSQLVTMEQAQGTLFQPGETALHSSHAMAHAGAQTDAVIPNAATCAVLSWLTSVYWRGGKPRTYVPGVQSSDTTDNRQLTTAAATGYNSAGTALHVGINALSATGISQTQHGFVSFMSGGVDRVPPIFFPISGCKVHKRLGTQRRRLGAWTP